MIDVWDDPKPDPSDPCVRRCGVSSRTGYCSGCFRTLNEIASWEQMSKDEQSEVLDKVKERESKSRQ